MEVQPSLAQNNPPKIQDTTPPSAEAGVKTVATNKGGEIVAPPLSLPPPTAANLSPLPPPPLIPISQLPPGGLPNPFASQVI